ncbi:Flp family type IVb pilin [Nocardioides terrisoli]|uniref:Flp family type IVb pilin n=1 Tax=Nocardioides terrisoli TaxID=3388267 RepID=UPI00287B8455|nr:Flp family type IVb pilin [Nocardioides marmorisolisilvae]
MFTFIYVMLESGIHSVDERLRARSEKGASAVEYGLLIAGIAAVIVVIVFALGGVLHNVFTNTCASINSNTAC